MGIGVELSPFSGKSNFERIKKAGYTFVILRAGFGNLKKQNFAWFDKSYTRAKEAGLQVGVYWYSYAKTAEQAAQEGDACLHAIQGKELDFPVWFDIEHCAYGSKSPKNGIACLNAFAGPIKEAGYSVGLLGVDEWLAKYMLPEWVSPYSLFIVGYGSVNREHPEFTGHWDLWMYTLERIPGVEHVTYPVHSNDN